MEKRLLLPAMTALLMSLTACSQSQLTRFQQQLSDITSQPAPGAQPSTSKEADRNDVVSVYTLPAGTGMDTAAIRLKQHFGFSSDEDVAAARNSGQGNAGWSASAISEGTSWLAQPGSYYRMSRNWAGNDRLTLEVTGNTKGSYVTATYRSSNPEHLKPAWTSRLMKQIPEVADGSLK
ncbi:hypothetical protein ACRARH_06830 [Phytobacter ursingii]